ncbi:MAG: threonylcarbamoyl-AMP synthase [Rhodobacterales bacterium]|nr:MAG: threonylcarbamoyl-AMP synthase [Rhodobacterales bacterium]
MKRLLGKNDEDIARAAELLRQGGIVAFPTETVYGLGGDAANGTAVARIYEAKGRPSFNPLIAHVADADAAWRLADPSPLARDLAAAFWPGALTLVLPLRAGAAVSGLVTAGGDSIALRVPAHPVARALLETFGGALAAPSANPSGRVSPTAAQHVIDGLEGRIDAVLDGGACPVGVESTILDMRDAPRLLRAGGVPVEALEEVIGTPIAAAAPSDAPVAPGMLASHYAPRGTVRLNAQTPEPGEVMLGFGPLAGDLTLSASGDLREAAANLFQRLHDLDAMGAKRIAVAPVPDHGLGRAINDRLRRAAAPR